jgi:hypothetical protein
VSNKTAKRSTLGRKATKGVNIKIKNPTLSVIDELIDEDTMSLVS